MAGNNNNNNNVNSLSLSNGTERLSLQAPIGLPSPVSPKQSTHRTTYEQEPEHPSSDTLISCFSHLALCSDAQNPFPSTLPPRASSKLGTREEQRKVYAGPKLSDRATGGPDAGPLIERFSCLFRDQYNCKTNPKGIVSLGVAENFLMEEECIEMFGNALKKNFTAKDLSYGDSLWGSRRINLALSQLYNDWFAPAEPVQPEQLITGVGCSAVLDQLFYTLMDEGEAILLAAPYYAGFDRDLIGRDRVRLIPVVFPEDEEGFLPTSMKVFQEALDKCKSEGVIVRAVIVCNPQNPLGRTYPRETLLEYARFCEENDLHLVSDEIYALSVYENASYEDAVKFTSVLSLDVERELDMRFDKARVHVVHGMSKDFCANGLRIGALISQHNPLLLRAMANTSSLMKISSPADVIFSALLNDQDALTEFIKTNQARLAEAHKFTRDWFEARGVFVANSNAGHYVWINLGAKLGIHDVQEEKRVFQKLLDGGVYIAPGTVYHHGRPGWYRITFSVARGNLEVGLAKMEAILGLTSV